MHRSWRHMAMAAVLVAALSAAAPGQSQSAPDGDEDSTLAGGALLVEVAKTTEDRLAEIAQWVHEKRFDEAQEALHLLMTSQDPPALHRVPADANRYETTIEAAARLVAAFPDEALDLYCKRHDLAAQELFEAARQGRLEAALVSVGRRYFHTPHGGQALMMAAAMAFDRGASAEAASLWERLYREHRRLGADRAMLLARAAIAWHLADERQRAAALLAEMNARHPQAEGSIAGRRTALAAFLTGALAGEPPLAVAPPGPSEEWPSLAGSPRSVAVMADCQPAPLPFWTDPAPVRAARIQDLLGVALDGPASPDQGLGVALELGRVRVRRTVPGQPDWRFDLPPLVHPIVVRGLLLCRRETAVVATSLASGKEVWRTEGLPMHRGAAGGEAKPDLLSALAGDMGRYALTADEARLYTVCRFSRLGGESHRLADAETLTADDGSSLVALSLRPDGADVAWEVGNAKGSHESLRQAKWLTAPTVHGGHLYAIARLGNRYVAMCLDAARGRLVWQTPLGLVPMRGGGTMSWQQARALEMVTERAGPPAVADGRVFYTTNAGIVTALDAATGAPLWAYRYDSTTSGPADSPSAADLQGQTIRVATLRQPCRPVNPLLVAQGRVVGLPSDSEAVLALAVQDGALLWRRDRLGQNDLTALDEATALLSGPDLVVLSLGDGAEQRRWTGSVLGRPTVVPGAFSAAGVGGIVRVDLSRGTLEESPLADDESILGHMVSSGGRLAAVNAAGCSLYADYETASQSLRSAIAKARGAGPRAALELRAAVLAMSAGRLDEAVRGLTEAEAAGRNASDKAIAAKAAALLFEARMRQFRAAGADEGAGAYLDQAGRLAVTADQRKQVLLERVRHGERLGRPGEAAACLQAVLDRQADRRPGTGGGSLEEYFLARHELAGLVRRHGPGVYAPFDAQIGAALDRASAAEDPDELAALARRWPLAQRAGEARLRASDLLVRRAAAGAQPDLGLAAKAARLLGQALADPRDATRFKALAARTVVDLRFRPNLVGVLAAELEGIEPGMAVEFGGFSGSVGDLFRQAAEVRRRPLPPQDPQVGNIALPLRLAYEVKGDATTVLRDTHGRPVRLGDRIFLSTGGRLTCLDLLRGNGQDATLWTSNLPAQAVPNEWLGQLGADGKRLAVFDKNALLMADALSGKELCRTDLDWLGPRGWVQAAGDRDWIALADERGNISCVGLARGERVWRARPMRHGVGRMAAWSDLLLVRDGAASQAVCLDLRTGRAVVELGAHDPRGRMAAAVLNPEGLAVTLDDNGTVSVRDVRQPGGAEWPAAAWGNGGWQPLAAGERFVALRSADGQGRVRVLDLATPERWADLSAGNGPLRRPQPVWMVFDGPRAVLLHADEVRTDGLAAPGLTAFEMPSGKRLWQRPLGPASASAALRSSEPASLRSTRLWRAGAPSLYGGILAMTLRSAEGGPDVHPYVVRVEDGEAFDCSSACDHAAAAWPGAGSPVVVNGWVIVPHQAGWTCLLGAWP